MRRKRKAFDLLDWVKRTPVLHVSSRYPATRGCLAMVAPLALVPGQTNAVIVYDLDSDPKDLIELDIDEIRDRLFTPRADLPEGMERIPLKSVHANRSPALAPLKTLAGADLARIGLDPARCERHLAQLNAAEGLAEKVRRVFAREPDTRGEDADIALYSGGFIPDADRAALRDVRSSTPERLAKKPSAFRDPRFTELLFRYRARNFEPSLSTADLQRWRAHCRSRLVGVDSAVTLNLETYGTLIAQLRTDPSRSGTQHAVLDALEAWGRLLKDEIAS
jgi:exodeoxyribonuclease I